MDVPQTIIEWRTAGSTVPQMYLHGDVLESVLSRVKGKKLGVISIIGPLRTGKSFLMSLIVRYLEYLENRPDGENVEWLFTSEPLKGFPFENSMNLVTSGIQIWPRPFFIGEIALILLDTPGIYEPNTSLREWAGIAATSLLLSSCTIFNVAQNLQEDSLVTLQTFLEYAKLLKESDQGSEDAVKYFQKVLFLIRDWNNPEFNYGDGNKFLQKKMGFNQGMSAESGTCRDVLKSNVEEMDCFLMPHPEDSEIEFDQPLDERSMDTTFGETLKKFIVYFLEPAKIQPKLLHGNPVNVQQFLRTTESLIGTFNSSFNFSIDVTNVSTVMRLESGVIHHIQNYKSIIERKLKKKSTPKQSHLDKHHDPLKSKLLEEFKERSKCDPKIVEQFVFKLKDRIDHEYVHFSNLIAERQQSLIKKAEEDVLNQLTSQLENLTISEQTSNAAFEAVWGRVRSAARNSYETKIAKVEKACKENFIKKLEQEFLQLYENTKKKNQSKIESILTDNSPVVEDAVDIYVEKIELLNVDINIILPEKLAESHQTAVNAAISLFNMKIRIPADGGEVHKILLKILTEKIDNKYKELQLKNNQAIEVLKVSLQEEGKEMLDKFKNEMVEILNSNYNLNTLEEQLQQSYVVILNILKAQVNKLEVHEKTILSDLCEEIESKLTGVYEEALKNLEVKKQNQSAKEEEVVNHCATIYVEKLQSKDAPLTPQDFASYIQKEKQVTINSCIQQLEDIQSTHIPDCLKELISKIDSVSENIMLAWQSHYDSSQEKLQKLQDDAVASFDSKISLMVIYLSEFTREELYALLKTVEESSVKDFSCNSSRMRFPTVETNKFCHLLQKEIEVLSQKKMSEWETYMQEKTEELKVQKNEEAKNLIAKVMLNLSKYDILDEDHFREEFSKARQDFCAKLQKELSKTKFPHSCINEIASTAEDTLTSLERKHWSGILKINHESEDVIRSRILKLKTEYLTEVLANVESRSEIADRFISNFAEEFICSSSKDANRLRQELEKELLALNDQVDSDEAHALEVEQRKQELMQKFIKDATETENLKEPALEELIESFTNSFSKKVNNDKVVNDFYQDLQREKKSILRKKEEQLKIAQLEQFLDKLSNEFRSLLQKKGSSQINQIRQQTIQKLDMLARKIQIDPSEYQNRLETILEQIWKEYQEMEKLQITEEQINKVIEDVNKIYHEEMLQHFVTPKYYGAQEIAEFHSDAMRVAVTRVPGARADEEKIRNRIYDSLNEAFKEFDAKNAMNVPSSFAIGIDLGTTYSCVGVYMNGQVEIIPNEIGKKTTPSYVYYANDGDIVVGDAAKSQSHTNPERTIYEVKRLIGRDIQDSAIQGDIAKWPFQVVNERGIAKVQIGEITYFPEEISAEILRKLKEVAEAHLNQKVTYAVITVPAYFTDGQKAATKRAGEDAGLEVLRIISEPTAAAIAYNLNWTEGIKSIKGLVYDMGGGTFDVALFTATRGDIKIINVGGDTHLGGVDFDNELVIYCCNEFQKSTGINLLADQESKDLRKKTAVNRKLMRLKRRCEEYKKDLSIAKIITVAIDTIHENLDLRVRISQGQFESLIDKYIDKSLEVVEKVLKEAQTKRDDIEEIVLIGGSTRIPRVRKRLMEFFEKALNTKVNPDEAVAVGAAYEAAVLNGRRAEAKGDIVHAEFAPRGFSVMDVTPMAYGIEIEGGDMCVLIQKQSQVPTEVSKDFLTAYHHQTSVQVVIYEGENPKARDNTLVGEFYLNGIPPALAGRHNIRVTMKVSPEGMINVAATCVANGISKDLTVRANKRSMGRSERIRQAA